MAWGPGKYDEQCTRARADAQAFGAVLLIFEGYRGNGFSAQGPAEVLLKLPAVLRDVADQIEKSGIGGT